MVSAGVGPETYRELLLTARHVAQSEDDARDLVQDALTIAVGRGVDDWSSPERQAWLRGVVRKHAAFVARTQKRRRLRERLSELGGEGKAGSWVWQPEFLASLPRSLRLVAGLASADLGAAEVRWLLQLTDTALRQRLCALRRALRAHDEPPTLPAPEPARSFGAQRSQILAHLRRRGGREVATSDPDGHVLFLKMVPHGIGPVGNP